VLKFALLALAIAAVAVWLLAQNAPKDTPAPPPGPVNVEIQAPNPLD
jgi:hypothetical protein